MVCASDFVYILHFILTRMKCEMFWEYCQQEIYRGLNFSLALLEEFYGIFDKMCVLNKLKRL